MKTINLLLCLITGLVAGCASYNYDLAVKNIGKEEVWCSLVASSRGIAHEPGRIVPNTSATFAGPFKHPYADKWTVAWKTDKGESFEKSLNLTNRLPNSFQGRLVFTIDANSDLGYLTESFSGK